MGKKTVPAVTPVDDGLIDYRVANGVTRINGQTVSSEIVQLRPEQALYDLAIGRLLPLAAPAPAGEGA